MQTHPTHSQRLLFTFGVLLLLATACLLYAGGYTTSIGAGMVFPDWPTSNGSFNPDGWLQNTAQRAEHGHRLLGSIVGLLMIIQAVLVWKREPRSWVRKLTYSGLILVILQGVLGGLRVLLDKHPTPWEGIDAGLVLRIVHGCTAQAFTCLVAVLTLAQSQAWIRAEQSNRTPCTGATRTAGLVLIAALVTQLIVAVKMRHMGAGLAIPTFPLTPDGGILPTNWSYGVAIHFSHRVLAVLILILSGYWLLRLHLEVRQSAHWKAVAVSTAGLLLFQIGLGAWIIWSGRHPQVATAHVICGAAFLATVVTSVVGLIRLGVCQAPSLASANQVPATLEARS